MRLLQKSICFVLAPRPPRRTQLRTPASSSELRPCIWCFFNSLNCDAVDRLDLKALLCAGATDKELEAEIASAILRKPERNRFIDDAQYTSLGVLSAIGG